MMPAVGHTTNASHAIAPWALALAPHQEPERPQRVHAVIARPNCQAKSRCLAVCPTRIWCPRKTGRQIAVPASWSQDSRLKARNCFSGLENHAFWVFGNSEHCLIHPSVYTRSLPVKVTLGSSSKKVYISLIRVIGFEPRRKNLSVPTYQ
jgi:hypothetical protein